MLVRAAKRAYEPMLTGVMRAKPVIAADLGGGADPAVRPDRLTHGQRSFVPSLNEGDFAPAGVAHSPRTSLTQSVAMQAQLSAAQGQVSGDRAGLCKNRHR